MSKLKSAAELEQLRNSILSKRDPEKISVSVCGGTGCRAYKCMDMVDRFKEEIKQKGLEDILSPESWFLPLHWLPL